MKYTLEIGQVISGRVNNFWGKKSKGANIVLISNYGLCRMAETDETGNFLIDGLDPAINIIIDGGVIIVGCNVALFFHVGKNSGPLL